VNKGLVLALVVLLVCSISGCGTEKMKPVEAREMDDALFAKLNEGMSIEEINMQVLPSGMTSQPVGNIMGEGGYIYFDNSNTSKRYILRFENGKVVKKEVQELPSVPETSEP
jgi:outer membrane protein assembly factor BamE (lipoprotein component of BamABCDE complex)